MRPISSIYNSFRSRNSRSSRFAVLFTAALAAVLVSACTQKEDRTVKGPTSEATGKGNGGNNLRLTTAEVEIIFTTLKPRLQLVFEGVQLLVKTEKVSPGATDLAANPEMLKNLEVMFGENAVAMQDLATQNNLRLQKEPCTDFRGVKNAAAAVLNEAGGAICFSSDQIKASAVKNFDRAAEIYVLALASHEIVHHFISTGAHETDEKAAQEIQNFIEQELIRQVEIAGDDVITTDETKYLQQFRENARELYESALPTAQGAK